MLEKKKMSDDLSRGHAPVFDGKNFRGWKFQVRTSLVAAGVFSVVDGTRTRPAAEGDELGTWIKDDAKAMSFISRSVEYRHLEPLLICTSSKEMWDKLGRIHEGNSASNKLLLTQRFHEYKMAPTDTVVEHVAKVQNMASQLLDVGETVSDTTVMAKMLAGLTGKFSNFVTAWDSVDPARQTVEHLQERLQREESRLDNEREETAAYAAIRSDKSSYSKKFYDGKNSAENKTRRDNMKKNAECYVCGEKGHFARECKNRFQRKNGREDNETDDCAYAAVSQCNVKSEGKIRQFSGLSAKMREEWSRLDKRDVWYSDSGASRHITSRREWFSKFRPDRGATISLGDDGVCEVNGEGTIIIEKFVNGKWQRSQIENVLYVPAVQSNLFSVGECTSRGYKVQFVGEDVQFMMDDKVTAVGLKQSNKIYRMLFRVVCTRDMGKRTCPQRR